MGILLCDISDSWHIHRRLQTRALAMALQGPSLFVVFMLYIYIRTVHASWFLTEGGVL